MVGSITNLLTRLYFLTSGPRDCPELTASVWFSNNESGVGVRRNRPSGKMTPREDSL